MNKKLTTLLFLGSLSLMNAQWSKATPNELVTRKSDNSVYYKLDIDMIRGQLLAADKLENAAGKVIVSLPTSDEKLERFAVNSFPVMDEALANQYQLGSYVGVGIDDPAKYVRFSVAPNDFQSMMISDGKYEFIEPATTSKAYYSVHGKSSKNGAFNCMTKESPESIENLKKLVDEGVAGKASNKKFHTLRLALSVTSEYTAYFGGVAGALTQMNATMTRVNGVFEKEFNLHLNMINAPSLIFTNAATDPYSSADQMCKWNYELMTTLGGGSYGVTNSSFDIGHLFGASGGGGDAGCIGCIGSNTMTYTTYSDCGYSYRYPNDYKGSGITSPSEGGPLGDTFDIDYVAHEFGHQLGDNHTFSRNEGEGVNVEPGSGSTIMGYAGITGVSTDVQNNSDAYFHTVSIDQVQANLASKTVDVETNITNNPPIVTAMTGTTYTIPRSTAFVLTAIATDPEGDALTYCWEQVDNSTRSSYSTKTLIGTLNNGASFRSWIPSNSPTRYFPKLATVLGGAVRNNNDFEATSSVARTTNYRVTVRDNKGVESQTAYTTQTIVVGSANAFSVNTPPTLVAGGNSTISWVVSGTNVSPYNATNVKIDFTSNAGAIWTTLAPSVPNSGTANVAIPESLVGKSGHIRVSAIGNVFYAVKPATISSTLAVSDLNNSEVVQIYPNPVKDILNVTNITLNSNYEIFNAAGQLVSKGNLGTGKIAVNKLTKGVYFISIDDNGTFVKTKFVKD